MEGEKMRTVWLTMLVLVLGIVVIRSVGMLPPETFRDPIFAAGDTSGDDGSSSEHTDFA